MKSTYIGPISFTVIVAIIAGSVHWKLTAETQEAKREAARVALVTSNTKTYRCNQIHIDYSSKALSAFDITTNKAILITPPYEIVYE